MKLHMDLGINSYDIHIEPGGISRAAEFMDLNRKVLVVTDSGVPAKYAKAVADQCKEPTLLTIPQGEAGKSPEQFLHLLRTLLTRGFSRGDCVAAVGGGVVGDLAGFAASCYMRGIGFYNLPTTLVAQVDASIGGKTAINLDGIKNIAGAFYQPKSVLIDPIVLETLHPRERASGIGEVIKMAVTLNADLFRQLEQGGPDEWKQNAAQIIFQALDCKRRIVELDERESGLRRVLNFGHTLGHGIEAVEAGRLSHGACVALGMLPMCAEPVRQRLLPLYKKADLPTAWGGDLGAVMEAVLHDKKSNGNKITVILSDEIGSCKTKAMNAEEVRSRLQFFKR